MQQQAHENNGVVHLKISYVIFQFMLCMLLHVVFRK